MCENTTAVLKNSSNSVYADDDTFFGNGYTSIDTASNTNEQIIETIYNIDNVFFNV